MARSSFDERFDALAALAYRVAYRILGSRAEAEDVAQEALARAYARWSRVEAVAEPWVARVSANEAIGVWRRRSRRGGAPIADPATGTLDDAGALDRLHLADALSHLPKRQREVVSLRYLADLRETDVAAALGCSLGAVKQHAHRGLAALRVTLTLPEEEGQPGVRALG